MNSAHDGYHRVTGIISHLSFNWLGGGGEMQEGLFLLAEVMKHLPDVKSSISDHQGKLIIQA